MLTNLFNGICMALADSVPGVSGGTIAFILGFYEQLLDSIHNLLSKEKDVRKPALIFLAKLMLGWIIGIIASVALLSKLFESHIYFLSSIFLGLTFFAIPLIIYTEKDSIVEKYSNALFSLLGLILVVSISLLRNTGIRESSIQFSSLTITQYLYIFASGMVAISAMILPGISGSTLLLIFGIYVPTITAVHELLHFNFSVFWGLVALGLGFVFGLAFSIHFVRSALKIHRSKMVYFILGLMLGSFYSIIMGPTTLENPLPPLTWTSFRWVGFLLGILILVMLEMTRKILEHKISLRK